MKFIILGLGNFGAALGLKLVADGHEVIGADKTEHLVESLRDQLTYTVTLDSSDEKALQSLPLQDADIVIISIGEDVGASVTATALIKRNCEKAHIISRASSDIHHAILEAMGVDDIIHPEAEFADQLASRLLVGNTLKNLVLDSKFEVMEVQLPPSLEGKTVSDTDLKGNWEVAIVTIMKKKKQKNFLGIPSEQNEVLGIIAPDYVFESDDILVLFGKTSAIHHMLEAFEKS